MLTASDDGTAKVWNASTGECMQTLSGHPGTVKSAVFCDSALSMESPEKHATSFASPTFVRLRPRIELVSGLRGIKGCLRTDFGLNMELISMQLS